MLIEEYLHQDQAPEERYIAYLPFVPLLWSLILFGVLAINISPLRGCFQKTKVLSFFQVDRFFYRNFLLTRPYLNI